MPIVLVLALTTLTFTSSKGFRVAATLFAADLGAGPLQTGIIFALWGLFPFLLSIYAGRLADRFDNRVMMYWGLAGFSAGLALPYFFPGMPAIYLAAALGGAANMVFVVATQNLVGMLASAETRTRYFSYYSFGESAAAVVGPIVVGLAIDAFRHSTAFVLLAAINAAGLALLFARRKTLPNAVSHADRKTERSAKDLLALPALRKALLANGLVMTGLDLFALYMPMYTHSLGFSATTIGLIMGSFGLAGAATRLAIPPLSARWNEHTLLAGALALSAIAFVTVPLTSDPVLLGLAAFVLGLGLGCGQPLTMILSFNAAPPGRSAEAISMRLAVSYGAHIIIPPTFGVVGAMFGLAPLFWTCAALLASGSVIARPNAESKKSITR